MKKNYLNTANWRKNIFNTLTSALIFVLAAAAVMRIYVALAYFRVYVVGSSMSSTLVGASSEGAAGGDYVYAFKSDSPRRGDIVVIDTSKKNGRQFIIKRVIALGGDTVELKDGVLYLNGEIKSEPYVLSVNNTPSENNYPETEIPEGCMFCMGDNRNASVDSRSEVYGCMPVEWTAGIVADWSLTLKGAVTSVNTFVDFAVPSMFGYKR